MNEHELRQALAGHAASIAPAGDVARLEAGLVRSDRVRAVRTTCAGAALGAAAVFGVMTLGGDAESTSVDVVDSPAIDPSPEPDALLVGDTDGDDDQDADDAAAMATSTTTVSPRTDATPAHLTAAETTTTTAIADADSPTTTAPPPPTTAPTPTTTIPPSTTAPTTTAATVAFTASARYGSCAEDPPYDEYSGTAMPGTVVTITSPHSATTQVTVDSSGDWWVRVEFPSAPFDEHFTVTVSDGVEAKPFDFVRTT